MIRCAASYYLSLSCYVMWFFVLLYLDMFCYLIACYIDTLFYLILWQSILLYDVILSCFMVSCYTNICYLIDSSCFAMSWYVILYYSFSYIVMWCCFIFYLIMLRCDRIWGTIGTLDNRADNRGDNRDLFLIDSAILATVYLLYVGLLALCLPSMFSFA